MEARRDSVVRFSSGAEAELGVLDLAAIVWASRWAVLLSIVCCTGIAAGAAWVVPNKYKAQVLLLPQTQESTRPNLASTLGSFASQLGGISSLVGLNLTSSSSAKEEALATLQSQALTDEYIRENSLLPILFSNKWDRRLGKWKPERPEDVPTLWKANRYFAKHVRAVEDNGKTGLITLTITWTDPKIAAQWANGLVKLTNDYMRNKAIGESERNIAYLTAQAAKMNVIELKESIYALMEAQIRQEMLARGSEDYALKVIDPAVPPEEPSFPRPLLWMAAGIAVGLVLGIVIAVGRSRLRRHVRAASGT